MKNIINKINESLNKTPHISKHDFDNYQKAKNDSYVDVFKDARYIMNHYDIDADVYWEIYRHYDKYLKMYKK